MVNRFDWKQNKNESYHRCFKQRNSNIYSKDQKQSDPTISWSDENSYEWCFDGEPRGGIVAVSSVGTQKSKESQRLFLRGYEEMVKRLEPTWVIFYGKVPEECDWNVIRIPAYY